MRYGVSSYSFRQYIKTEKCDYFKICDLAKEFGYEGIEFIGLDNKEFGITEDPMVTAKEIREYCKRIDLEIIAYTVGANLTAENPEAEVEGLLRCVDVAAELGAKVMRHDVCYSLPKGHPTSWREAIKIMAPLIRRVTEYAEAKGVRTCTENHGFIFQAPERVEELILAVNHKNYGWLVDMGNFLCADAEPAKSCGMAAPYAFLVHAKDMLLKSSEGPKPLGFFTTTGGSYLRGTVIGHGAVPIKSCITALKKGGYDGWLSVEFEGMEDNLTALKASIDYLKACEQGEK